MITVETRGNCTRFKVTGEVTAEEIVRQALDYMAGKQTDTSLWDFTQAARVKISTPEMKGIAEHLKSAASDDKIRKVAIVGSTTINIGLGKLFAAFAQIAKLPYTYKVFRNLTQAEAWLDGDA